MKLDKNGWRVDYEDVHSKTWYGVGLPVWEFDLYFADSMRHYDTEYVRARDNRQAKRKIKKLYPWVIKFDWGDGYAD